VVIVVGGGPAGIACAVQLKRSGIPVKIIERKRAGGLVWNAWRIENYPGFPEGISGEELAERLERHLEEWDIPVLQEEVKRIEPGFRIFTNRNTHETEFVVVASGTIPRKPGIPGEDEVFYEVVDIPSQKGSVTVVGGGDIAFDYAINLSSRGYRVRIVARGVRALGLLQERAKERGVKIYTGWEIKGLEKTCVYAWKEGEVAFSSDYVLLATGRLPNVDFIDKRALKEKNLFLAGDVKNGFMRQVAIACGDGVKTAMKIRRMYEGNF